MKIYGWLQGVGLFGVVASLLFVGLQMKQDREIALSAATQARTDTTIQNVMGSASNPIYASAIDKIQLGDEESLLPSEERAVYLHGYAALYNIENVHYQYLNGFVSEERWIASRQTLKGILRLNYEARQTYDSDPAAWRESYRLVVEDLINEIDSEDAVQQ